MEEEVEEVSNATGAAAAFFCFLLLLLFPIAVEKKSPSFSSSFSLEGFNVCVFFRGRIRRENELHVAREQSEFERRGRDRYRRWHTEWRATAAIDRKLFSLPSLSLSLLLRSLCSFFPMLPPVKKGDQPPSKDLPLDVGTRGQVGVERLEAFSRGESGERDHFFFFGKLEGNRSDRRRLERISVFLLSLFLLSFHFPVVSLLLSLAMEPLTVLREFASSGRLAQVSLSLDDARRRTVKFGDQFEFGADAPTRWRAKGIVAAGGANASSTTLPLGALAFFATSPTFFDKAPWGDYLKNARSAGFATVPVVDRKVKGGMEREC